MAPKQATRHRNGTGNQAVITTNTKPPGGILGARIAVRWAGAERQGPLPQGQYTTMKKPPPAPFLWTCTGCHVRDLAIIRPGTGPHAYRADCRHCGRFLKWVSSYTPAERNARRRQVFQRHQEDQA